MRCPVSPGFLPALPITPKPPSCTYSPTGLNCTGFGGSAPFQFVSGTGLILPAYALDLESYSNQGSAFSPQAVALQASPDQAYVAFSASLSFAFAGVDAFRYPNRGFTFLLSANSGACGSNE